MKKALIVVDYQKDFVDGSLGFPGAEKLEGPIVSKIEACLQDKADVIFTFDTHGADYLQLQEGKKLPVLHCEKGSEGWALYGRLADYLPKAKAIFEKPTFGSMELAVFLKQEQYDCVELVGLVSSICVISNAVLAKAALPEAEIIIDENCTDGFDKDLHRKALDVMEGLQMNVQKKGL